jgi:serine/threonine protein phosphatase PrpC
MLEISDIERMCGELDTKDLVHQLIDLANQNGGVDNSTVVSVRVN